MRQWIKSIAVLALGVTVTAAIADDADDISPYLGADYYYVQMKSKNGWDKVFPNQYPGGASVYVGTKFHQNFGLELGYDWSQHQEKEWTLPAGSVFFQTVTTALSGTTRIERNGGHLDVLTFLPVADCFELVGSVGFGWVQTKIEMRSLSLTPGATIESSALASTAGKGSAVFRVGVGGLYMLTDMVGVKAKLGFEGTSTLKLKGNNAFVNAGYNEKAFKGSTTLAVGAFFKF